MCMYKRTPLPTSSNTETWTGGITSVTGALNPSDPRLPVPLAPNYGGSHLVGDARVVSFQTLPPVLIQPSRTYPEHHHHCKSQYTSYYYDYTALVILL